MNLSSIHIEKRESVSLGYKIFNPVLFVALSLAFSAIFIVALGFNPIAVYRKMISFSFFQWQGFKSSVMAALPLILCGLSVTVAFKMNLNNIGAEGQYAMGAILGGGFALFGPDMPIFLKIIVMFVLCALGGGLWAGIAALLKAYWNVNETIVTLMLNYIALLFLDYLCYGPWMAGKQTTPITEKIPEGMYLHSLGKNGINGGIVIAVILAILLYLFFKYTTAGYQAEVIKNSISSARYGGMNVTRNIIFILILSGAIAGLAGFVQITGVVHRIQAELPGGTGYTGIVIAYLSRFNPLAVIFVSILLGGLNNSSSVVQMMGVPSQIATMMQGSIMIFIIAGEFFTHYKVCLRKKGIKKGDKKEDPGKEVRKVVQPELRQEEPLKGRDKI